MSLVLIHLVVVVTSSHPSLYVLLHTIPCIHHVGPIPLEQFLRKSLDAYSVCTESGVVDDLSEDFPYTSSGNRWDAVSDRVMGGLSTGSVARETSFGREANVLRGTVTLANNGGFIQMATDLGHGETVDASGYSGIELMVRSDASTQEAESFSVQYVHYVSMNSKKREKGGKEMDNWNGVSCVYVLCFPVTFFPLLRITNALSFWSCLSLSLQLCLYFFWFSFSTTTITTYTFHLDAPCPVYTHTHTHTQIASRMQTASPRFLPTGHRSKS